MTRFSFSSTIGLQFTCLALGMQHR